MKLVAANEKAHERHQNRYVKQPISTELPGREGADIVSQSYHVAWPEAVITY